MQHTLKSSVTISGIGLHSGAAMTMVIRSANANHGIVFKRVDFHGRDPLIPARWDLVADTRLCTVIANADGASVGTIEHVMAALRGCGVDNALIEIDGPEVPVMDGSAAPFVAAIDRAGTRELSAPRHAIKILKTVAVERDGKRVCLSPAEASMFAGQIDFSHPAIGRQYYEAVLFNGNFRHELSEARTFGFAGEVEAMQKLGLARGGSLANAIVLDDTTVLNADGLRFEDEFIRHKLLDAVGDLYLAGGPIIGAYRGYKAGHALNNAILHELFAQDDAWAIVDVYGDDAALPAAHFTGWDTRAVA